MNDDFFFNPNTTADEISASRKIIYSNGNFYEYVDNFYQIVPQEAVKKWAKRALGSIFNIKRCNEVIHCLLTELYVPSKQLNGDKVRLNLENGILNISTGKLELHTPDFFSTIRIPIEFDAKARCPLFEKTVGEIFSDDVGKISVLQEFMGYSLTASSEHQVALLNVGEGANGKSVLFYVFQQVIGRENCSSIPMECFGNRHYLAQLDGKLVNISIESEAKGVLNDSNFKAVVTGDMITVDRKYGHPYEFSPITKLIFCMNTLPRVDDKTDAFFRRLMILRYNRQFSGASDNKNLKFDLLNELPGILNWMINGLRRLEKRGHFELTKEMRNEVSRYRLEQNNVLQFVEECCELFQKPKIVKNKQKKLLIKYSKFGEKKWSETKSELYSRYSYYCKYSGCKAMSKINFGRQLKKHFPRVGEEKTSRGWIWTNIRIKDEN